jgi:hypothetical protein
MEWPFEKNAELVQSRPVPRSGWLAADGSFKVVRCVFENLRWMVELEGYTDLFPLDAFDKLLAEGERVVPSVDFGSASPRIYTVVSVDVPARTLMLAGVIDVHSFGEFRTYAQYERMRKAELSHAE